MKIKKTCFLFTIFWVAKKGKFVSSSLVLHVLPGHLDDYSVMAEKLSDKRTENDPIRIFLRGEGYRPVPSGGGGGVGYEKGNEIKSENLKATKKERVKTKVKVK
jgi:hypothetical protein